MKRIDRFMEESDWGYRSRAEVIAQAIRDFLQKHEAASSGWRVPRNDREPEVPSEGSGTKTTRGKR